MISWLLFFFRRRFFLLLHLHVLNHQLLSLFFSRERNLFNSLLDELSMSAVIFKWLHNKKSSFFTNEIMLPLWQLLSSVFKVNSPTFTSFCWDSFQWSMMIHCLDQQQILGSSLAKNSCDELIKESWGQGWHRKTKVRMRKALTNYREGCCSNGKNKTKMSLSDRHLKWQVHRTVETEVGLKSQHFRLGHPCSLLYSSWVLISMLMRLL